MKLDKLMRRMKGKGYILAEMDFGLPDMDDKQKLEAFCHHSKGLWSPAGIFKNLPMCSDCHKVSYIFRIAGHENNCQGCKSSPSF
jgi:hypothetical protein